MSSNVPPPLDHLIALSDDTGILQHADDDVPNRNEGYCTDDAARAFIVAIRASERAQYRDLAIRLARTYLAFLRHAQLADGRFHNFMSFERTWLDEAGSEDSIGRACWAVGFGARYAPRTGWRHLCLTMLERSLPHVLRFEYPRARAFAALGIAHAVATPGGGRPAFVSALRAIGFDLIARLHANARPDWQWFEDALTYDNARLPEALLSIGTVLEDPTFVATGLETLAFYESIVVEDGTFVPIGNAGWYVRGGPRARFAQQPLEAAGLVDAALAAYAATGLERYLRLAECGFAWFTGRNSRGTMMAHGGGCCDGLEAFAVNPNMGAESTLAYLASAFAVSQESARPALFAR